MIKPTPEVIAGLLTESRPYFLEIERGLQRWESAQEPAALSEPRRMVRRLKGAARVMGLDGLASIGLGLEEALDEMILYGQSRGDVTDLRGCTRCLEGYLQDIARGEEGDNLIEAAKLLRQWRGELETIEEPSIEEVNTVIAAIADDEPSLEFIDIFRQEASERLVTVGRGVRSLVDGVGNREAIEDARRALHTLKGAAGVIGLRQASTIAHQLEDLLSEALDSAAPGSTEMQLRMAEACDRLAEACGLENSRFVHAERRLRPRDEDKAVPYVRLPLAYLDELGQLVGEMVATRSNLIRVEETAATSDARAHSLHRLGQLTGGMQDCLRRMRLAPVASISSRLQRAVRVTGEQVGKAIDFAIEGGSVEMDRGALEELVAPLEHLLRNAIDHGIEPAEWRMSDGKPQRGQLRLRAFRLGEQAVIEVSDDGAGVDVGTICSKAVAAGVLDPAEASTLDEQAALELAFVSGISTAREVTETSGRGIGLAIVKAAVSRLQGGVTLETANGRGTTFRIGLPYSLNLADRSVARMVAVEAGSRTFAIPLAAISRVMRAGEVELERAAGKWIVHIDGEALPAMRLDRALGLVDDDDELNPRGHVILSETDGGCCAWMVDRMGLSREGSVKDLGGLIGPVPGIAGATADAEGNILLVIDPVAVNEECRKDRKREASVVYLPSRAS